MSERRQLQPGLSPQAALLPTSGHKLLRPRNRDETGDDQNQTSSLASKVFRSPLEESARSGEENFIVSIWQEKSFNFLAFLCQEQHFKLRFWKIIIVLNLVMKRNNSLQFILKIELMLFLQIFYIFFFSVRILARNTKSCHVRHCFRWWEGAGENELKTFFSNLKLTFTSSTTTKNLK